MIHYRPFRNADPPHLVRLWHESGLGRGAAAGFSYDALELFAFCQPYFDPAGLIVACDAERPIGIVHAGFGAVADESRLDTSIGVVCALMVHPEYRRRGIGRELLHHAEDYLRQRGAARVFAGPAPGRDPFYVGLYGGGQPAGFLESDPLASPFFCSMGYEPVERIGIFQRDLNQPGAPMNLKLLGVRRRCELAAREDPERMTWWWSTRVGRLDTVRFLLLPKGGGAALAAATVIGLDAYLQKWQQRCVGFTDLFLPEQFRSEGYAEVLLVDVCKRLRDELITLAEAHAAETDPALIQVLTSAGFRRVDTGVVYRKR